MKSMTESPKRYPVCEIFGSLQGEGFHTGTPATFLRFSGCNRKCRFCDTDHSLWRELTADEIVELLEAEGPQRHLVATGGEPAMWLDDALTERLHRAGYYIQIETNGSLKVPDGVDWVTCSPKEPPLAIEHVDELKIVFEGNGDEAEQLRTLYAAPHNFLQPCSGRNTGDVVRYIMQHPWWRLSLQTHLLIGLK